MAPNSSTLAWKIPWTEEPGGLQSMGLIESDTTERLHVHFSLSCIGEGNGNPLQCFCLENPKDGGAWWSAQSWTGLKWLNSSSSSSIVCLSCFLFLHAHQKVDWGFVCLFFQSPSQQSLFFFLVNFALITSFTASPSRLFCGSLSSLQLLSRCGGKMTFTLWERPCLALMWCTRFPSRNPVRRQHLFSWLICWLKHLLCVICGDAGKYKDELVSFPDLKKLTLHWIKRKWHELNVTQPQSNRLATTYWLLEFEMWLVQTEMYSRYKVHTGLQRFGAKSAKQLINNIYIDYMWCDNVLDQFSSVQSLSCVFATPWTSALQASLFLTNSWSPPKSTSIEPVIPSNHLTLCRPLI